MEPDLIKVGERYCYGKGKKMRRGVVVVHKRRLAIKWDDGSFNYAADVVGNLLYPEE